MTITGINVATYNILSSAYDTPSSFPNYSLDHIDSKQRLVRIKKKLETTFEKRSIICLQEVSQSWAGDLDLFFESHKYKFIYRLYGGYSSDYMGVGIAVPREMEILKINYQRISDVKRWIYQKRQKSTYSEKMYQWLSSWIYGPVKEFDTYRAAKDRYNMLVSVFLKFNDRTFWVSTYHMPCMFNYPDIMLTHAALVLEHLSRISEQNPVILAGDFNIKPDEEIYNYITTNTYDKDILSKFPDEHWSPITTFPLQSSYKLHNSEPPYTTSSWQGRNNQPNKEPFIDTLDYIFVSAEFKAINVKKIDPFTDPDKPELYPNESEPSDHLMIEAFLGLS